MATEVSSPPTPSRTWAAVAAALVAAHVGLLTWGMWANSATVDEAAHVPAGLAVWHAGDYSVYRVNPPLPRVVAALFVLPAEPATPDYHLAAAAGPTFRAEWQLGVQFAERNADRYRLLVFLARLPGVAWSLAGMWVAARWAAELFGPAGGRLTLFIWAFEPTILAQAQIAAADLPAAVSQLITAYALAAWWRRPGGGRAGVFGACLGLALLTKFTVLAVVPVWAAGGIGKRLAGGPWGGGWVGAGGRAAVAAAVCLGVVGAGYEFHGVGARLDSLAFASGAFAGTPPVPIPGEAADGAGNRFRGTWAGGLPVPVPAEYLRGIDLQWRDFERMPLSGASYLRGEWRERGWWYFYLYALAVKLPHAVQFLLVGAGVLFALRRPGDRRGEEWLLWVTAAAVLVAVSSQTGFTHHSRYALPALPPLYVAAGRWGLGTSAAWRVARAAACGWLAIGSLAVCPHSLAYFNEAAGGPGQGDSHLLHSNIDYGQDMYALRRWLDDHPEVREIGFACYSSVPPRVFGIPARPVPPGPGFAPPGQCGPRPGYYAVSVAYLRGVSSVGYAAHSLAYFRRFRPVGRAGYSVYIYHLTEADIAGGRNERGAIP